MSEGGGNSLDQERITFHAVIGPAQILIASAYDWVGKPASQTDVLNCAESVIYLKMRKELSAIEMDGEK